MLAPRVNQHRNVSPAQNVQSPANQRKTVVRKVFHWRCKLEFAVEPGLYGVLVGGGYVGKVARLQRTNMRINQLGSREGRRSNPIYRRGSGSRPRIPGNRSDDKNRSRNRYPTPGRNSLRQGDRRSCVQIGADFLAKRNRRAFTKTAALKSGAQRFFHLQGLRAITASFEMALEFCRTRSVQFAIQVAVQRRTRVITAHEKP